VVDTLLYVALVLQLGDSKYAVREAAVAKLTASGPKAYPPLMWGYRGSPDKAVRSRCYAMLIFRPGKLVTCYACKGSGTFLDTICQACYGWGTKRKS